MPYLELYYHLVWATKDRQPLLIPRVEKSIHQYMREKAIALGSDVYAIDGTVDHVHMVTTIPAAMAVSKFVGQIKGIASNRVKRDFVDMGDFAWQREYAALSVGKKHIDAYIAYVNNQKMHHETGDIYRGLERTNSLRNVVRETPATYDVAPETWREVLAHHK